MNLAITNIYVGYVEKQITPKPAIWAWFVRKSAINKEIRVNWQDEGENNYTPRFAVPKYKLFDLQPLFLFVVSLAHDHIQIRMFMGGKS